MTWLAEHRALCRRVEKERKTAFEAHKAAVAAMDIAAVRTALTEYLARTGYNPPDRELFNRLHHLTHAQGRRSKANGVLSWEEELQALGLKPGTVRQWKRRYRWYFDDTGFL